MHLEEISSKIQITVSDMSGVFKMENTTAELGICNLPIKERMLSRTEMCAILL
jgi:hypothetical protein